MGFQGQITYNGNQIVNFQNKTTGTLRCGGKFMATDVFFEVGQASASVSVHGNAGYTCTATNNVQDPIVETFDEQGYCTLIINPTVDGETWTFTNSYSQKTAQQAIMGGQAYSIDIWSNPIWGPGTLGDVTISSAEQYTGDEFALTELCYKNLTITAAGSITMTGRNAGLVIRTTENCTIAGPINNRKSSRTLSPAEQATLAPTYPAWMLNSVAGNGGPGTGNIWNGTVVKSGSGGVGMPGRFYGGGYGGGGGGGSIRLVVSSSSSPCANGGNGGGSSAINTSVSTILNGGAGAS